MNRAQNPPVLHLHVLPLRQLRHSALLLIEQPSPSSSLSSFSSAVLSTSHSSTVSSTVVSSPTASCSTWRTCFASTGTDQQPADKYSSTVLCMADKSLLFHPLSDFGSCCLAQNFPTGNCGALRCSHISNVEHQACKLSRRGCPDDLLPCGSHSKKTV